MSVKIRFMRTGRKNLPQFRLVAVDTRYPRDGKAIEILGHYDPLTKDDGKKFAVAEDRVKHWIAVGALPSPTAWALLKTKGFSLPIQERRDRSGRKKARAARTKKTAAAAKKKK